MNKYSIIAVGLILCITLSSCSCERTSMSNYKVGVIPAEPRVPITELLENSNNNIETM